MKGLWSNGLGRVNVYSLVTDTVVAAARGAELLFNSTCNINATDELYYYYLLPGKYKITVRPKATQIYGRPYRTAKYHVRPLGRIIFLFA